MKKGRRESRRTKKTKNLVSFGIVPEFSPAVGCTVHTMQATPSNFFRLAGFSALCAECVRLVDGGGSTIAPCFLWRAHVSTFDIAAEKNKITEPNKVNKKVYCFKPRFYHIFFFACAHVQRSCCARPEHRNRKLSALLCCCAVPSAGRRQNIDMLSMRINKIVMRMLSPTTRGNKTKSDGHCEF